MVLVRKHKYTSSLLYFRGKTEGVGENSNVLTDQTGF
jgi:hypothetical protein